MGIEFIDPSENYLEFMSGIRTVRSLKAHSFIYNVLFQVEKRAISNSGHFKDGPRLLIQNQ